MISVEARKYLGKYVILVREWDGFDQPQYTFIFKITEEELDFKGGRFSRKAWFAPYQSELIIAIPGSPGIINIEEVIDWVSKNTAGKWNFEIFAAIVPEFVWKFAFDNEKDAVAFKLRWANANGEFYEFSKGQWK